MAWFARRSSKPISKKNSLRPRFESLEDRTTPAVDLVSKSVFPNLNVTAGGNISVNSVSEDGRYAVFTSAAGNLAANDANATNDVFLYDANSGSVTLISKTSSGAAGNNQSSNPIISANGRYVAFSSYASDLVAGDANGTNDVFVYDVIGGGLTLASHNLTNTGTANNYSTATSMSDDGNFVVFESYATDLVAQSENNNATDVFLFDLSSNQISLVSHNAANTATASGGYYGYNQGSSGGRISGDGRYVVFTSYAEDLTSGSGNYYYRDVYVYERSSQTVALVSGNMSGTGEGNSESFSPSISRDGTFITYVSSSTDLVSDLDNNGSTQDVFLTVRPVGLTLLVSHNQANSGSGNNSSTNPAISADGSYIAFESNASDLAGNDINGTRDIYLYTRSSAAVQLLSQTSTGFSGNSSSSSPRISSNGRFVTFTSNASDLAANDANGTADIFVFDRSSPGSLGLASRNAGGTGNSNSSLGAISGDGSIVYFNSNATNLASGDNDNSADVFRYRTDNTALPTIVSARSASISSAAANSSSSISTRQTVSDDGRFVVFVSSASDLATGDTNATSDVFLYDRVSQTITLISHNASNTGTANSSSSDPVISADGNWVAFASNASDLGPSDSNGTQDVYLWSRATGAIFLVSHVAGGTSSGNNYSLVPSISDDGSVVAFRSNATDLVTGFGGYNYQNVFVFDRLNSGAVRLVSHQYGSQVYSGGGYSSQPSTAVALSGNGQFIAFEGNGPDFVANGNPNGYQSIYVWKSSDGSIALANMPTSGSVNSYSYTPTISDDGKFVAYRSSASNLVANDNNGTDDIFLYDRVAATNILVSRTAAGTSGNNYSLEPAISGDGKFVAFSSSSGNLVTGDSNGNYDVFVYDVQNNSVALASPRSSGSGSGNSQSRSPSISSDGSVIAFYSSSSNLTDNDTNGSTQDVFAFDRIAGKVVLISRNTAGTGSGNSSSASGFVSGNGQFVVFQTNATNLIASDANNASDIFIANLPTSPVSVGPITPDPRNTSVTATIDVYFTKPVQGGFGVEDVKLTRNGVDVPLSNITISPTGDPTHWTVTGLGAFTTADGVYVLTVDGSGVLDANGETGAGKASDSWTMDSTGPTVANLIAVSPDPRNTAVDITYVVLSEVVDLSSFTYADLTLTRDNVPVALDNTVQIAFLGGTVYEIRGLAAFTSQDGTYQVTVSAAAVQDPLGNTGSQFKSDTWVMDTVAPIINSVASVTPNPRNSAVDTIDVTFSKPINVGSFGFADLALTRDSNPVQLNGTISVALLHDNTYRISGLGTFTALQGAYSLTVNGAGILDIAGNSGSNSANTTWTVDTTAPFASAIENVQPDPRSTAVSTLDVTFSELIDVSTFTWQDITLTRNSGQNLATSAITIALQSGLTYRISGLGTLTDLDGGYSLTVNVAGIKDLVGNSGTGTINETWTMDSTNPSVLSVGPVTPDPRNTSVSYVLVTMSEAVNLSTFDWTDLALTRNNQPVTLDSSVTIVPETGATYRIQNLGGFTSTDGTYVLTVNASQLQDLFGTTGEGSKSDTWVKDSVAPNLVSLASVVPSSRTTPVFSLDVNFDKAIDITTFDWQDVSLTRDGGSNLITANVNVSFVSGTTYRISNLQGLTSIDGSYTLTVTGSGIVDAAGNTAVGTKATSWLTDATGPSVQSIAPVNPDPRTTPVTSIDVTLSEQINLGTFTFADLALTRDNGPNLITSNVTVTHVSGTTYRINNLAGTTAGDGNYALSVNAFGIRDALGNSGTNSLTEDWLMNATTPSVSSVGPVTPSTRNNAVDAIDVIFSEAVDTSSFDWHDLTLTRDCGANLIDSSVQIVPLGGSSYQITGLAAFTGASGAYQLGVSAAAVQDLQGGAGSGSASTSWSVDATAPFLTSVGPVTPNVRSSPVTNVTVVFSEAIDLATFTYADLTITRNGGPNLTNSSISISPLGANAYEIGLPTGLTSANGAYSLSVNAAGVKDVAGNTGTGSASTTWSMDTLTAPSTPTMNGPTGQTDNRRPTISWTAADRAASYDLWVDNLSTGQSQVIRQTVNDTSFVPTADLSPGTYRAWVRAIGASSQVSNWTASVTFSVVTTVTPTIISPAGQTDDRTPTFGWTAGSSAVRFDLWVDNLSTGQSQVIREQTLTSNTFTPLTDLPYGAYRVWVRAFNAQGVASEWSAFKDVRIVQVVTPTFVTQSGPTIDQTPTFTWSAISNAHHYDLWIDSGSMSQYIRQQQLPTAAFTPTTPLPAGGYTAWVRAIDANGVASAWSAAITVRVTAPAIPQFTAPTTPTSNHTPTLIWTGSTEPTKYDLWVDNLTTGQSQVIRQPQLSTNSFTPTTLLTSGTYRAWVRAINLTGDFSDWSAFYDFVIA
jgi:hypothetical protein